MYRCVIIGLSDSHRQYLQPEAVEYIRSGKVFSGGKRHHELVRHLLPDDAVWIDITVPLDNVFKQYEQYEDIIIFASGDPLFYGFANTIKRLYPEMQMKVLPAFNSLQMLVHRLNMAYQDMRAVSLTGRPWDKFDEALICGEQLIGCLTDRNKTPNAIWKRMLDYGYDNYMMYVGENLGNEERERISIFEEGNEYDNPNCIILKRKSLIHRGFGIPDSYFHLLNGRSRMITKMPIRLASIAAMELDRKNSFWDIGFCTGSISIEAKLAFPHLHVTAFEIREEGKELMEANSRKFHAPGINAVIGDFLTADISRLESPEAVFIGGYGGRMKEMLAKVKTVLAAGGCIVFNSVSEESRTTFIEATTALGMKPEILQTIKVDDNNPITILRAI